MVIAAMLVMTDLTRHILLDAGLFEDALAMNDANGGLSFAGRIARAAGRPARGVVRSGSATVRVNMRSGALISTPPKLQFDLEAPRRAQAFSLEDSIFKIEQALANGELRHTSGMKSGLEKLHALLEQEQERSEPVQGVESAIYMR